MKIVYIPVYRITVSYAISFGRRWSVIEHLLLIELSKGRRSVKELSVLANLPDRLVVEALINLLRANWIEVRSANGVFFQATTAGRRRASEESLPPQVKRSVKWIPLCFDRLTGTWLRADDLELVYERDLPPGTVTIDPLLHTYQSSDGRLRDLFYIGPDEALEPAEPQFRNPSRPFARVVVAFDRVERGLPSDAQMSLKDAILEASRAIPDEATDAVGAIAPEVKESLWTSIREEDVLVGGKQHREFVTQCLSDARSNVILHSCFIDPGTIESLLPEFEAAARRKVRVDLLWGLHFDPEDPKSRNVLADSERILNKLSPSEREFIQLSPISSGSHAKIIIYNPTGFDWQTLLGSCNFLSSWFRALEVSVALRSNGIARLLLSYILAGQLPASGSWSPVARRINRIWDDLKHASLSGPESGTHRLTVLADQDHYSCIRTARDLAQNDIVIGCDLYGLAAETSVLVPMTRAAEMHRGVRLLYQRSSKQLRETGQMPKPEELKKRGIILEQHDGLHGKFLLWDQEQLAITSFNWAATATDGTRVRGGELGVLIDGPMLRSILAKKLLAASNGAINISAHVKLGDS
jgi:hypothetical protein